MLYNLFQTNRNTFQNCARNTTALSNTLINTFLFFGRIVLLYKGDRKKYNPVRPIKCTADLIGAIRRHTPNTCLVILEV